MDFIERFSEAITTNSPSKEELEKEKKIKNLQDELNRLNRNPITNQNSPEDLDWKKKIKNVKRKLRKITGKKETPFDKFQSGEKKTLKGLYEEGVKNKLEPMKKVSKFDDFVYEKKEHEGTKNSKKTNLEKELEKELNWIRKYRKYIDKGTFPSKEFNDEEEFNDDVTRTEDHIENLKKELKKLK